MTVHELFAATAQEEYQAAIRQSLSRVFSPYLNEEIEKWNVDPQDKDAFLKRRLPVYMDALVRGIDPCFDRLKTEAGISIEIMGGIGKRTYRMKDDTITYTLSPISAGEAHYIHFYEDLEKQYPGEKPELSGDADLWTDENLLNQVIFEGRKIQQSLYQKFFSVHIVFDDLTKSPLYTQGYFQELIDARQEVYDVTENLKKRRENRENQSLPENELFIEHYVATSDSFILTLPRYETLREELTKLTELIPGYLIRWDVRPFLNTLAVEFLTQNIPLPSLARLRDLVTSPDQYQRAKVFIEESNSQSKPYVSTKLAYRLIEPHKSRLMALFKKEGYPPERGIELLRAMLTDAIQNFEGLVYVHSGNNMRILYPLSKNATINAMDAQPSRAPKRRKDTAAADKPTATDILRRIRKSTVVSHSRLLKLPQKERLEVFRELMETNDSTYKWAIMQLAKLYFNQVNIGYDFNHAEITMEWTNQGVDFLPAQTAAADFLNIAAQNLRHNNSFVRLILEREILSNSLPLFVKSLQKPEDQPENDAKVASFLRKETLPEAEVEGLVRNLSSEVLQVLARIISSRQGTNTYKYRLSLQENIVNSSPWQTEDLITKIGKTLLNSGRFGVVNPRSSLYRRLLNDVKFQSTTLYQQLYQQIFSDNPLEETADLLEQALKKLRETSLGQEADDLVENNG